MCGICEIYVWFPCHVCGVSEWQMCVMYYVYVLCVWHTHACVYGVCVTCVVFVVHTRCVHIICVCAVCVW